MTEPLDPERERKIRRNYADSDPDGTVPALLAELDRLRDELAAVSAVPSRAAWLAEAAGYVRSRSTDPVFAKASVSTALCAISEALDRMADEAQPTPIVTVSELAHAIDNSTPYPIEIHSEVCRFMAERLLEMLTIGKRPEHAVWQPEEEPPTDQPEPTDPDELRRLADEEPQQGEAEGRDALMQAPAALASHAGRQQAALTRIGEMADAWEKQLPEVIRTPAVVSAIRAALELATGERP